MTANPSRISYLDGVRGIAVLLVFFSHTSGRGFILHPLLNFHGLGHIGVYLFFVLSAFFLGNGLFKDGVNALTVRNFYIKRFFRILPLYYLVLLGVFFYQRYTGTIDTRYLHINGGWHGLLRHFLLYQGDGVFWSVVIEMQFYLIVPLLVYLLIRYREKALVLLWCVALGHFMLYTSKFLHFPFQTNLLTHITPNSMKNGMYLELFMSGITASYFLKYRFAYLERNREKIQWIALVSFGGLLLITVMVVSRNFMGLNGCFYKLRYLSLLYALVFSLFVLSVYLGNLANKLLNTLLLRYIGIWGFSVYLLHMAVFRVVNLIELPPWAGFFAAFMLLMIVSGLSYLLIEKTSINLSYTLIQKLKNRTKKI